MASLLFLVVAAFRGLRDDSFTPLAVAVAARGDRREDWVTVAPAALLFVELLFLLVAEVAAAAVFRSG